MGKTTDLVMSWLRACKGIGLDDGLTLALKQMLLILIECTVVPVESIARLGCSCLRHIVISSASPDDSGGILFGDKQWDVVCLSLCRATQLTLYPLHQLMAPFYQVPL